MERDLWKCIVTTLKSLPRRWPQNGTYHNGQILAVLLWAALHDRPVSWACHRCNWPVQAWRRELPDQSTMSRRMRDPLLLEDLKELLRRVQRKWPAGRLFLTDGKAFAIGRHTTDRDAANGYGGGRYAMGYKLHVVIDDAQHVQGWELHAMNYAESRASATIVSQMPERSGRLLIGDASYDSNPLYDAAAARKMRLVAPRRKPGRKLGHGREQHRDRLHAIIMTEQRRGWMWRFLRDRRTEVERYFAGLVTSGVGAAHLPTWVRRLRRCRLWIGSKLVINAARIARNRSNLA